MRTLSASLVDHPMAMLRGIAALRGIELTTNVRDDAAEQLAAILDDGVATAHALADCSPAAHTAWSALQAAGGRLKTPVFARSHGIIRPIGPARLEREAIWQQPQTPAEELWYRGLIFRGFADLGDGPAEYIYIPSEIAAAPALSTAGANLPASSLVQIEEPPSRRQAANSLAVDLCALLAALRETPAHIDRAGQIRAASDRARLSEGLVMPDALRSDLAMALARARGWLAVDRERLVLNAQAATAWLRATPWEQMTTLFEAWRDANDSGGGGWNDLRRIPGLQAEGTWRNDPVAARARSWMRCATWKRAPGTPSTIW